MTDERMLREAEARCIAIPDVEPIFVEQMILGAMTYRYLKGCPGLSFEDAAASARAVWESDMDWEEPRDFEQAIAMVDADLEHWDE